MNRLDGKVAFISGAARGIGAATARLMVQAGARVAIGDVLDERGRETARAIAGTDNSAMYTHLDVTREDDWTAAIAATVSRFGGLDILVNNAGRAGRNGRFLDLDLDTWREVIATNLTGVFLCSQAAARTMVAQSIRGRIINIGSLDSFVAEKEAAAYAASKGGVLLLTKAMAVDLAEYGILVNCLVPGSIPVERNRSFFDREPVRHALGKVIPLGHPGDVTDVAAAALFLASDDGGFVTGTSLVVDGGYLAYGHVE